MPETHLLDTVQADFRFTHAARTPDDTDELQSRLLRFLRDRALCEMDRLFDAAVGPHEAWRLDTLDLDLGQLTLDAGHDWEDACLDALREGLARRLADLREAAERGDDGVARPVLRPEAQLQQLLHFLRHGRMPWYGRGNEADDPQRLAQEVLRRDGRALAAAIRQAPDRADWVARLAAQFDGVWLAQLVHALLPDAPSTVAQLLDGVMQATRRTRASGSQLARWWEATLNEAVSDGVTGRAPDRAVRRLQLELALDSGEGAMAQDDPLRDSEALWRHLLRDDRSWLKATLQRHGPSVSLEHRLAQALPTDLLMEIAGLWLATAHTAAVHGWIHEVAARRPLGTVPVLQHQRTLWQAALGHLWAGGGDANFDGARFVREVRQRTGWTPAMNRRGTADDPEGLLVALSASTPPALLPAPGALGWLRADAGWWDRLRAQPAAMQQALRSEVQRGDGACRALVRSWTNDMLLEAACLPCPEARLLVATAVCSPPCHGNLLERRWVATLRHVHGRSGPSAFDETGFLEALVVAQAEVEGRPAHESAAAWTRAASDAGSRSGWMDRVMTVTATPVPWPGAGDEARAAIAGARRRPEVPVRPPAERVAEARSLAVRVTDALGAIASSIGRRLGRLLSPARSEAPAPAAQAANQPVRVGNAGLVLLGPYLPRLFDALGLTRGPAFADAQARERALHFLQFAVDGLHAPAPESALMLNKLLCGVELETPVGRRFEATPAECELVDGLLSAVIAHWRILGATSVGGLRETFLQREARLTSKADGSWVLAVAPGSFDMLLDQLPWGYALQKLPWMSEVLHVEWR